MLIKQCAKCGKYIPYGKAYCSDCEKFVYEEREKRKNESRKKYNKTYDSNKRNERSKKFYASREWRMLSARYLQIKKYRCERCGNIATQVHHQEYITTSKGWEQRLDINNLEALCLDCHNAEHKRFNHNKGVGVVKKVLRSFGRP